MKDLKTKRYAAEAAIKNGITNREALREGVKTLVALESSYKGMQSTVRECSSVARALNAALAKYVLAHPTSVDLSEYRDGVRNGELEADGNTYHVAISKGEPKREGGDNLTQSFIASLPVEWQKTKLELNAKGVTDEELAQYGLERETKCSWRQVGE